MTKSVAVGLRMAKVTVILNEGYVILSEAKDLGDEA
jgi:hypothetical protein